jgi:hypothetical protein
MKILDTDGMDTNVISNLFKSSKNILDFVEDYLIFCMAISIKFMEKVN